MMMLAVMMVGLTVSCPREEARRCEVGASGPHSRPRSSVVVTGSHRVVASVFRGFYRGTPVVFSSTKLIHEFGVHLRSVHRDVPCAPAVGRCVRPSRLGGRWCVDLQTGIAGGDYTCFWLFRVRVPAGVDLGVP